MKVESLHCHSFVSELAKKAEIAIDCGANNGDFARWLSDNTTAKIFSFEPDPRLFKQLPSLDRVEWIESAVDGTSGVFQLSLGEKHCSSAVYREASDQKTVKVGKTSLDDFCVGRGIEKIDFLKIDIEGAELNVLEQCSERLLRSTVQVTVEFHDFLEPSDLPRIKNVFKRMQSLGFFGIKFSYHTWGDCLFLNTKYIQISQLDRTRFFLQKYSLGIHRLAARFIKFASFSSKRRKA
jgi:FkbM family methyltransferase